MADDSNTFRFSLTDEFIISAQHGRIDIMKKLDQSNPVDKKTFNEALLESYNNGHKNIVEYMLKDSRADPTYKLKLKMINDGSLNSKQGDIKLFKNALFNGESIICRVLLLTDEQIREWFNHEIFSERSKDEYNKMLVYACSYGLKYVVKCLLKMQQIDPTSMDNLAIVNASIMGNAEIVEMLLMDGRVDPSVDNNAALVGAASCGVQYSCTSLCSADIGHLKIIKDSPIEQYVRIVELLLANKRVNPSTENNRALYESIRNTHDEIAVLLLNARDRNVNLFTKIVINDERQTDLFISACEYNCAESVKIMLKYKEMHNYTEWDSALNFAISMGHFEITNILLQDGRFNPVNENNKPLRLAVKKFFSKLYQY